MDFYVLYERILEANSSKLLSPAFEIFSMHDIFVEEKAYGSHWRDFLIHGFDSFAHTCVVSDLSYMPIFHDSADIRIANAENY